MKTNILKYYCDIFGEDDLIGAIQLAKTQANQNKFTQVTNPIMRYLMYTTDIRKGKIHAITHVEVPPDDHMKFNFAGFIMNSIKETIVSNPNYLLELRKNILGLNGGSAMAALNEVTVASFYRNELKIEPKLNSSVEKGMPDVELVSEEYSTDAKTFPNMRFLLTEVINNCRKEFGECFRDVNDGHILVFVWRPSQQGIKDSLRKMKLELQKDSFSKYEDDNIHAIVIGNEYDGGDIKFTFPQNNLTVSFQANWAIDKPMEDLEGLIKKSVEQTANAGKSAVTWVMFPVDASRHGIEITVLGIEGKLEEKIQSTEGLDGIVLYSYEWDKEKKQPMSVVDVRGAKMNEYGINRENVSAFIKKFAEKKVYIRK